MKRASMFATAAIATLVLCGCGPQHSASNQTEPEPTGSADPAVTVPFDQVEPEQHVPPVWDDTARVAATERAKAAMSAFARPDLSEKDWLAQLSPFMTPELAQEMSYTDPAGLLPVVVSGEPRIVDESSVYLARVEVPTDGGTYTLLLVRESADTPWLVTRFMLPEVG